MKPIAVVAPGIAEGIITAGTVYDDKKDSWGGYSPKNYNTYMGLITIRQAIVSSQNIPMVRALADISPETSLKFLESVGLKHLDFEGDNGLALSLGGLTNGSNPLEMAGAYGAIANDRCFYRTNFLYKSNR